MTIDSRSFRPLLGLCLLVVASVLVAAPAGAAKFTVNYSGATSGTEMDIDDDGVPGVLATGSGKGKGAAKGGNPVTSHAVFDAAPAATTNCAADELENQLTASTNVLQDSKGNQLYLLLDSGYLCVDGTFTTFTMKIKETVIGGTGKFAGASGTATTTCSGVFLEIDFITGGGRPAHGAYDCKTKGKID